MANEYFSESSVPSTGAGLTSSTIRAEFALIGDGFDKLALLAGNGGKVVGINSGATAQEAMTAAQVRTAAGLIGTSTDNAIVRFDSTAGATQNSVITIGDTGNVLGMGTLGCGAITTTGVFSGTSGTFSTTLGVTGASTLAAMSATTGTFSSTLGVSGASTLAAVSATTGTFSSTLSAAGSFSVNTDKFTVDASTGNSVVAGTLGVTGTSTLAAVVATSMNGGQLAGLRNKVINGDINVAQNGATFAVVATGTWTADQWQWQTAGVSSAHTITQNTDVPSSNEFQKSLRVAITTADASIAAGDLAYVRHPIEGWSVRDLIGQDFVLGFWVRSSKTGVHCASFNNTGADRSYVLTYSISAINTWEYKTVLVSGGLITAGTWDWTNGVGLTVNFVLACGSTYQTTAGAWQTGAYLGTSAQVNCLDTIGNIFAITGVQVERGTVATPFEHFPFSTNLDMCEYFFEKSFPYATAPQTNGGTTGAKRAVQVVGAATIQVASDHVSFKKRKRASSTVTIFNPMAANNVPRNVQRAQDWGNASAATILSDTGFSLLNYTSSAASAVGDDLSFHWTADARF